MCQFIPHWDLLEGLYVLCGMPEKFQLNSSKSCMYFTLMKQHGLHDNMGTLYFLLSNYWQIHQQP